MTVFLKDNTKDQQISADDSFDDMQKVANIKISDMDGGNVLIFPSPCQKGKDKIKDKTIFTIKEKDNAKWVTTENVMGFIGIGKTKISIASRFADDAGRDYFLHYMLEKVNMLNIVNFDTTKSKDPILDFLIYLFPPYLARAMRQGLYKEYKRMYYNNANIKGPLDVTRHIRHNIPFQGNIAYTTREYSYDNPVLQLVRHTIEYIKTLPQGTNILSNNDDTRENIGDIIFHTPSYNKNSRQKIISVNRRPVTHPYFIEYFPLQRLCLQILRHEKLSLGDGSEKIHGILFDGAWLWESYIAKVLSQINPRIEHKTTTDNLFVNGQGIIPDFITYSNRPVTASFIGDAKYKFIDTRSDTAAREDYYQVITYMCRYSCKTGFIFFPFKGDDKKYLEGNERVINNDKADSRLVELGLYVPQGASDFKDFCEQMDEAENKFKAMLNKLLEI
jgi:5-methylcytosine-specific restriction endonuclease McrBC regulatory subunit McrC